MYTSEDYCVEYIAFKRFSLFRVAEKFILKEKSLRLTRA